MPKKDNKVAKRNLGVQLATPVEPVWKDKDKSVYVKDMKDDELINALISSKKRETKYHQKANFFHDLSQKLSNEIKKRQLDKVQEF